MQLIDRMQIVIIILLIFIISLLLANIPHNRLAMECGEIAVR
jgi:hypothetical protein